VIKRFGGWQKLCEYVSDSNNAIAVRSQLREAISSLVERESKTGCPISYEHPALSETDKTIKMLADKVDIRKKVNK